MNTIVSTIPGYESKEILSVSPFGNLKTILINKTFCLITALICAIIISALTIICVQAENRLLFSQLSALQKQRDNLRVEWGQLLLEESTWSTQARIQEIAEKRLNMIMPQQKNIIIIQQQ